MSSPYKKDAERYQWLREHGARPAGYEGVASCVYMSEEGLDQYVDDAIAIEQTPEFMRKELYEFVRGMAENYDHCEDAHKYGSYCYVCDAEKLVERFGKRIKDE